MEVFHFSEEQDIRVFVPRPPPARAPGLPSSPAPVAEDARVVWAIDGWHAPLYYFPRDCPRVMIWSLPTTTDADRERWLAGSAARQIAFVEWEWLDRMRAARVFRYAFSKDTFTLLDGPNASPGTWLSETTVEPLRVEPIDDLLAALCGAGVELRLVPSLAPLKPLWESTLHASGVRLRNSKTWPAEPA